MKAFLKKFIPKDNTKVSLFIIGAQKSGTTALHEYLLKHPNIIGANKKELNFFNFKTRYF